MVRSKGSVSTLMLLKGGNSFFLLKHVLFEWPKKFSLPWRSHEKQSIWRTRIGGEVWVMIATITTLVAVFTV